MTDETTHLRALLAEQTARAEMAEALVERAEVAFHGAIARANQALAACAEMREALTEIIARGQEQRGTGRMIETAEAALSRTDLGAGKVLVDVRLLETLREAALGEITLSPKTLADLDALLKKGGG